MVLPSASVKKFVTPEILVAMAVVVRRRRAVDAKHTGTCRCFVGQVGIEQQGLRAFGKDLGDLVEVKSSKGRIRS